VIKLGHRSGSEPCHPVSLLQLIYNDALASNPNHGIPFEHRNRPTTLIWVLVRLGAAAGAQSHHRSECDDPGSPKARLAYKRAPK